MKISNRPYGWSEKRELVNRVDTGFVAIDTRMTNQNEGSINLVWSPPWSLEKVTEEGRRDLWEFGVSI